MRPALVLLLASCAVTPRAVLPKSPHGLRWQRVPAGIVVMGSDPDEIGHDADESPRLKVAISSFEMLVTAVTVEQWASSSPDAGGVWREAETPRQWLGQCNIGSARGRHPATCVSHQAARAFCLAQGADLPTEAEREYTQRGGTYTSYPWGDAFEAQRVISSVPCGQRGCAGGTAEVVTTGLRCNRLGLCDLTGNVWEWTASDYQESLGPSVNETATHPSRPVYRGGSWLDEKPSLFRVSMRGLNYPTHGLTGVGFRCVRR